MPSAPGGLLNKCARQVVSPRTGEQPRFCEPHQMPRGSGRAARRWRSSQPAPGPPPACPAAAAASPVRPYPCIPRCGSRSRSRSLAGRGRPHPPFRVARPPAPLPGPRLRLARPQTDPARPAGSGGGGAGRGRGEGGRERAGSHIGSGLRREPPPACVRRGRGSLAEPRARARETGKAGEGWEGEEGSGCEPGCGSLRSPQPPHQSLLRRLGRLPPRRGKMPLTQGCEQGGEVAAGTSRAAAAAAAAAVRVL